MEIEPALPSPEPALPPQLPQTPPAAFPPPLYGQGAERMMMVMPPMQNQALMSTPDDRTMGMLCHLLSLLTGFLGPLILWLVKKDQSRFVDHHGREALNFHLSMLLYGMCLVGVTFVLMFVMIGFLLFPIVIVLLMVGTWVFPIMAALAAQRGEWYRYPMCIRFF